LINWYFNLHPQTKYRVSTRSTFSELDMNQHFICDRITVCTGNFFNWLSSNIWWKNNLCLNHILRKSRNKMQSWSWSYGSWICDYLCVVSSNPTQVRCTGYTTLWDKVGQWLAAGRWFSPSTLVSSINKTDKHDITEILLKVALNTITLTLKLNENYKKKMLYLFLLLMLKFS